MDRELAGELARTLRETVILGCRVRRITLYSRPGCCLCDVAREAVRRAAPDVVVEEIDVDSDPLLRERFGYDIPVAVSGGRELFRHRFDPAALALLGKD